MRVVIGVVAVVCVVGFLMHRRSEVPATSAAATASTTQVAAPTPSVSQHNWPKSSLDRANDVKRQVLEQRRSNNAN